MISIVIPMFVKASRSENNDTSSRKRYVGSFLLGFFDYDRVIVPRLEMRELDLGVGSKLLQKLGWQPGVGLGKEENGPIRPVLVEAMPKDAGLGFKKQKKEKSGPPAPIELACEV